MRLRPFYLARTHRLWSELVPLPEAGADAPEPQPTVTFEDRYEFDLGGRPIELLATPGGETIDSLVVWLPHERTLLSGNLFGPIFGHVPNLATIRGDKIRSASEFIQSIDRVRALEPSVLVAGRGSPIRGADAITAQLRRLRDAVEHLLVMTIRGMNQGKSVFELMREVTLPAHLTLPEGHGKVSWAVRAIWEYYAGWFRCESTTELYPVPPSAVWPDLVDLAGGADLVTGRAAVRLEAGESVEALHLVDIALATAPAHETALRLRRKALELLLKQSGRQNFSETRWLEGEIVATIRALAHGV
jgi:alkyl sulfatase BDS1-like metallo-beta-lactamase superfamily hydrolase